MNYFKRTMHAAVVVTEDIMKLLTKEEFSGPLFSSIVMKGY